MGPHPLEYARTPETRRKPRRIRRRATIMDWVYLWLVIACYVLAFIGTSMRGPGKHRATSSSDYANEAYGTYITGVAAILSIALALIGLRRLVREDPRLCSRVTLAGSVMSIFLAQYLSWAIWPWWHLARDSFRTWWYNIL